MTRDTKFSLSALVVIMSLAISGTTCAQTRSPDRRETTQDQVRLAFFAASFHGELEQLKLLVRQIPDINFTDRDGQTALFYAARGCQLDVATFLIERGAKVNLSDLYGFTALHEAARVGCPDIAKRLIQRGANVNATTADISPYVSVQSPLQLATEHCETKYRKPIISGGDITVVQVLIGANADVNRQDNAGHTALYEAVAGGCLEIARILLLHGANADETVLDEAKNDKQMEQLIQDPASLPLPAIFTNSSGEVYSLKGLRIDRLAYTVEFQAGDLEALYGMLWLPNEKKPTFWNPLLDASSDGQSQISLDERRKLACEEVLPLLEALNGANSQHVTVNGLTMKGSTIHLSSDHALIPVHVTTEIPGSPILLSSTFIHIKKEDKRWTCDLVRLSQVRHQSTISFYAVFE